MKILENKSLFKKLIFALVLFTVVSFCIPGISRANVDLGGALLKPITRLFLALGDGITQIIHSATLKQSETLLIVDFDTNKPVTLLKVIGFVVGFAVVGLVTGGAGLLLANVGFAALSVGTLMFVATLGGVAGVSFVERNMLDGDLRLPMYSITPQEIFANKIPVFDVDFFNPSDSIYIDTRHEVNVGMGTYYTTSGNFVLEYLKKNCGYTEGLEVETISARHAVPEEINDRTETNKQTWNYGDKVYSYFYDTTESGNKEYYLVTRWNADQSQKEYLVVNAYGSPEGGGTAKVEWQVYDGAKVFLKYYIDVKVYDEGFTNIDGEEITINSTASQLQSTISSWYIVLRNIALVALLSVLVYVGIRIIISSTSGDKAKYKQFLIDWVVALCLLFVMHYIMSFSNIIVDKITDLLDSIQFPTYSVLIEEDKKERIISTIKENKHILRAFGFIPETVSDGNQIYEFDSTGYWDNMVSTTDDGEKVVLWNTNLMGYLRIQAQRSKSSTLDYVGYTIMFCILVLFTVYFIFTYLKRVLYMAFLTIIAPLVALTYPIDKMNDGKAQAFNMWLKEYIFNLLIQPLHLLIYVVLVGSAIELAATNVIYGIVAIAFMIPAEKLLRRFFGFEKAQTPGLLAGPAGSALAWTGLQRLMGHKHPRPEGKGKAGKDEKDEKAPRFSSNFDKEEAMLDGEDKGKYNKSSVKGNDINRGAMLDGEDKGKYSKSSVKGYDIDRGASIVNAQGNINNNDIGKSKKKISKHPFKALGVGAKRYTRGLSKKAKNSIRNLHPLRAATGVLSSAAFATAGGIVGLTSGDASKAFQYATAGAVGGYGFGKSAAANIGNALEVDGVKEEMEREYYGSTEEYEEAQKEKYVKQMKRDEDTIRALRQNLNMNDGQVRELMESDFIDSYIDAGMTDVDDMIIGYQMEKEKGFSRNESIAGIKQAKRFGDMSNMDEEKVERIKRRISSDFARNERVKKEKRDPDALADKTFNIASTAWKLRKNIK